MQRGTRLEKKAGDWSAPAWSTEGEGEHSVAHQRAECASGISPQVGSCWEHSPTATRRHRGRDPAHPAPALRSSRTSTSNAYRARGVGGHLSEELERLSREHGDTRMVVSATPSSTPSASTVGEGSCRYRAAAGASTVGARGRAHGKAAAGRVQIAGGARPDFNCSSCVCPSLRSSAARRGRAGRLGEFSSSVWITRSPPSAGAARAGGGRRCRPACRRAPNSRRSRRRS